MKILIKCAKSPATVARTNFPLSVTSTNWHSYTPCKFSPGLKKLEKNTNKIFKKTNWPTKYSNENEVEFIWILRLNSKKTDSRFLDKLKTDLKTEWISFDWGDQIDKGKEEVDK